MKFICFIFFLICANSVYSQNISATYKVTKDILNTPEAPKKFEPLEFTGYYYVYNKRVISYLKPEYLQKYPTGRIEIMKDNGNNNYQYEIKPLCTDSIISVSYSDADSLIWRYTTYIGGSNMQKPRSFKYEEGFIKWKILDDTKEINGLLCQHAVCYTDDNKINWDVWFFPEIQVPRGVDNTFGIPGLVVEAYCPLILTTWKLMEYKLNAKLQNDDFWPELFNQPFVHRGTIKNKNKLTP
jgi:GLPGLI family protein